MSTVNYWILCVLLMFNDGIYSSIYDNYLNRTLLTNLQQFCPYSSFCEENATMSLPMNNTKHPCCESCSCEPGCEINDNCCFSLSSFGMNDTMRKCMSPVVTNIDVPTAMYLMIHSCLKGLYQSVNGHSLLCSFDKTDYKSFAPVTSRTNGEIYVNADCATCNNVHDIAPWKLGVKCPKEKADHSYDTPKLLRGEYVGRTGCYMSYVPPNNVNVERRECRNDVVRKCNVTGKVGKWEPLWEFCPMINATFSKSWKQSYGNIFCYLCNEKYIPLIPTTCSEVSIKYPTNRPFTVVLADINLEELDNAPAPSNGVCKANELLVHSFKTECRRVECSWGKYRLGNKCKFHSNEWIGGPFTVVLKLSPFEMTQKINISSTFDQVESLKYDKKASWLKRNAMKGWNVQTLYKPAVNRKYVEYILAFSSYPKISINPTKLQNILKKTLKETWILEGRGTNLRLKVELNSFEHYRRTQDENGIDVYLNSMFFYNDHMVEEKEILLPILFKDDERFGQTRLYINNMFLCDQIDLHDDEFEFIADYRALFKVTNTTLYETEYRFTEAGRIRICLNKFAINSCYGRCMNYYVILLWILLAIMTPQCSASLGIGGLL